MAEATTHRCEAKAKGTGEQCKRLTSFQAQNGRWLCAMHGRNDSNPGGAPPGSTNALKTGERAHKTLTRQEQFQAACDEAPTDHRSMREAQAKRNHGRIKFMYDLLLRTEAALEALAAAGDGTALNALAVVEIARKQEPRTTGEGDDKKTELADVELSTKSRSLLDRWLAQQFAIERAERTYGTIAEGLRPRGDGPGGGGIGTLIINNSMPGVDDDEAGPETA